MEQTTDRRVSGVRRVSMERVVDVCGKGNKSAFQARSVDVSGHGMHVRTKFLPELDSPLVLRFQERDAEIIVEGEVAWRTETPDGGEFGVRFTALDSGSVKWLKTLCSDGAAPEQGAAEPPGEDDGRTADDLPPVVSSTVKLHLSGLAAPMRAEVKEQGHRRLDVGSNLEFLRVGRALEVEEVGGGQRRQAEIEGVNVAIDPRTQIPQLILSLRYPEPAFEADEEAAAAGSEKGRRSTPAGAADPSDVDDDEDASAERDSALALDAARQPSIFGAPVPPRVAELARRARELAGSASERCVRWSKDARRAQRWLGEHLRRVERARPRRTSPVLRVPRVQQLRPQHPAAAPTARAPKSAVPSRRAAFARLPQGTTRWAAVGAALFASVLAIGALWPESSPPEAPAARARQAEPPSAPEAPVAVASPSAESGQGSAPAPLAAIPLAAVSALDASAAEAARTPAPSAREARPAPARPAFAGPAVTEFSRGRLHLPIVYRLRLDDAGERLAGEPQQSGFSVTIPGRKVMEKGDDMTRRDRRIEAVSTKNGPDGAKIVVRFAGKIPAYKVRLRGDFVEIFISKT